MEPIIIVGLVIALALFFDFTNGFHDTANAMATPIATGALKPRVAVAIAALMNLVGAFLSTTVAKTISVDMINPGINISAQLVFAGLTGAILWNLTTWFLGLPSSSSHALFGGLIGSTMAYFGAAGVNFTKMIEKVFIPAIFAPLVAGIVAFTATKIAYMITARSQAERKAKGISTGRNRFKIGQIFSSSLVALSHGTNDAQKTMGVITLVLVAGGYQSSGDYVQFWVVVSAAIAIALGTYAGGWRIIKTLGTGLSEIRPAQGFAAEVATGVTILASSRFGFALSTTQVASGSVIGVGLGRKGGAVRWGKAGQIFVGWLFTLPASALVGAGSAYLTMQGDWGLILDASLTAAVCIAIFTISRRNKVNATNVHSDIEDASEVVLSARAQKALEKAALKAAAKQKKKSKKKGKK
jgi:PiT family inorganic phosphate transporter